MRPARAWHRWPSRSARPHRRRHTPVCAHPRARTAPPTTARAPRNPRTGPASTRARQNRLVPKITAHRAVAQGSHRGKKLWVGRGERSFERRIRESRPRAKLAPPHGRPGNARWPRWSLMRREALPSRRCPCRNSRAGNGLRPASCSSRNSQNAAAAYDVDAGCWRRGPRPARDPGSCGAFKAAIRSAPPPRCAAVRR